MPDVWGVNGARSQPGPAVVSEAVLSAAYILSALLELGGLALVMRDLREAGRRTRDLLLARGNLPYTGARITGRASSPQVLGVEIANQRRMDEVLIAAFVRSTSGGWRRYVGPFAIGVGIIVGTAANLAAS